MYRERWPYICASSGALGVREQYIRRHTALQQMKFDDPLECYFTGYSISPSHIMLDRNDIFVAQVAQPHLVPKALFRFIKYGLGEGVRLNFFKLK